MRTRPSWLALLGATLALGCAAGNDTENLDGSGGGASSTTSGHGGASSGEGGAGGDACVPEEEICDEADNDCDGDVDEGCECSTDETQPCYAGPGGTRGVGACKPGTQTCDPRTHTFGDCENQILPVAETCNGIDDDCNGTVDDGIADLMCGVGGCQVTVPGCTNGSPTPCVPGSPSLEVCDGIDNNCNQLTDESFPNQGSVCDTGTPGACQYGVLACMGNAPVCVPDAMPTPETCNTIDDDCNGVVDDGIPGLGGACSTGAPGVCSAGVLDCQGGMVDCYSIVSASPETCNGLDDDCNAQTDEGDPEGGAACSTGQLGVCAQGTEHCTGGSLGCIPNAMGSPETCNGLDDNCDGQSDEGNPGGGGLCSCGGIKGCTGGSLQCSGCTVEQTCSNGGDDDGDNLVDCSDSDCALGCAAPACGPGEKRIVVKSKDIPKAIPDSGSVNSVAVVDTVGTIKRVRAQVQIVHTWDNDLTIALKSPNGPSVDLSSNNGGSGDNYTGTQFDDVCAPIISSGLPPFAACFAPEGSMATFNNNPANGTWTLTVADTAGLDVGTLQSWTIALCVQ